jgi:hypothetical protein
MGKGFFVSCAAVFLASGCAAEERSPRTGESLRTFIKLSEDERPRLGKPILLTLDLVNEGGTMVNVDYPEATINGSLVISGPDGKPVPYIGGLIHRGGYSIYPLGPGMRMTLTEDFDFDLRDQYLIDKPGRYVVGYEGKALVIDHKVAMVKPCTLEVDVAPGKLDRRMEIASRLFPIVPKGLHLSISPRWPDDEDTHNIDIEVYLPVQFPWAPYVTLPVIGFDFRTDGVTPPEPEFLGKTGGGFLFASVQKRTEEFWPHWRKAVIEALGVTPP